MKAEIEYNERLTVRFGVHPPQQEKTWLKEHGFWWDGRAGVWWLARPINHRIDKGRYVPVDGFELALAHLTKRFGLTEADVSELRRKANDHAHQRGAAGMEEALGIQ